MTVMAADLCQPCSVAALSSPANLQRLCNEHHVVLSEDSHDAVLQLILHKLGPRSAEKTLSRLIKEGHVDINSSEYEVETIMEKRYCSKRECDVYLIKWKNWPKSYNTWEPVHNLGNCEEAMEAFQTRTVNGAGRPPDSHKRKWEELDSSADEEGDLGERELQLRDIFTRLKEGVIPYSKLSPLTVIEAAHEECSTIVNNFKPKIKSISAWASKKKSKTYREHKASQVAVLKSWEIRLQALYPNNIPIKVENDVDLEALPETFTFVTDYVPTTGVPFADKPVMGCTCEDGCRALSGKCCPHKSSADFAYTKAKRTRLPPGSAIFECNKLCTCGPNCWNRVVQLGTQVKICIFKTRNGCGWGVKALQKIKKGTFVMEYLGEIINNEEAERRGKVYDSQGLTYLFDLDFDGDDCVYTIDAQNYGNVSHFVNHSCDPNMSVYAVWINNLDTRLPRIGLFANRDIHRQEELTFDYKMTGDTSEAKSEMRTPVKMSPFKPCVPSPSSRCSFESIVSGSSLSLEVDELMPFTDRTNSQKSSPVKNEGTKSKPTAQSGVKPSGAESNKEFSCKNYRMVCHCGAANCRKFLF